MDNLQELTASLSNLKGIYDILRIVDPINKCIVVNHGVTMDKPCYSILNRKTFCNNCIAMRSYIENTSFIKIEEAVDSNIIYSVISLPINYNSKKLVLELIKDISKSSSTTIRETYRKQIDSLINKLNEKIVIDESTGIYNKSYINERLPVDINNSFSSGKPLSIIMADIDHLEKINIAHGYSIGDSILKDFSILATKHLNNNHWAARYGGEEFLIVLNNTDLDKAFNLAEDLRISLENESFKYHDTDIKVTASFGVYSIDNRKMDAKEFINNVSKNLLRAKLLGRNKTIV